MESERPRCLTLRPLKPCGPSRRHDNSRAERRPSRTGILRSLWPPVAARQRGRARLLSPLRGAAQVASTPAYPNHLGARCRRYDLLFPANLLPLLATTTFGSTEYDTIMGGVVFLYTSGSWPLALIVLIASVMVPLGKLVALGYLLISVQSGSIKSNRERTRLFRMVEVIGCWSMLDVFVDTFTVALVQLQPLMSVRPGPGVVFFAAVVVLTMIAASTFDPRLIWDAETE
ncbi:MAG: paraquat-inducible protein A [Chromatiaceae bacterium]|nr:paraquat-inducible protein A [Chromatiaceae bacterium]